MDWGVLTAQLPMLDLVARLGAALLLGALLGLERERRAKPAGLKTHMLVALGSSTFTVLGLGVLLQFGDDVSESRIDPTRVIEGVIGGIGFLGAGSIIQSRGRVQGITTGASVWTAGAVGAACGLGAMVVAAVATVMALITLTVFARLERRLTVSRVRLRGGHGSEGQPAHPLTSLERERDA